MAMMNSDWLKRGMNSVYGLSDGNFKVTLGEEENEKETEWITVEGYKGTDKDMKCRDFQYDFGKVYTMDGKDVNICEKGFHLCRDLDDVFAYYAPGDGNRFFKVRAEVKQDDLDRYGDRTMFGKHDKLVARNIEFLSEVEPEELCNAYREKYANFDSAPDDYILRIFNGEDRDKVCEEYMINQLKEDGYSELVATYIAKNLEERFYRAHALAQQHDMSMDAKMICIMCD